MLTTSASVQPASGSGFSAGRLSVGVSSILYMTSTTAIVQVEAKREMHGRVLALQTVLLMGTAPIGGPLSGWLADTMGARAPIILGGIVCLVAAASGHYATRRYVTLGHRMRVKRVPTQEG